MRREAAGLEHRLAAALERVGAAAQTLLRSAALAEGLSATQVQLLLQLAGRRDGDHEPAGLARRFDVSRPTITDAVAALERKGLVARAAHTEDGRRRVLSLTARGHAVARRLVNWDRQLVEAVDRLPHASQASTLQAALDVIAELVNDGVVSVARMCTTCTFF